MNIKEMEQFLVKLKSIISCKIIVDKKNDIEELHILSNTQREPKQISRDIQSMLISEFGINIDHKKISIAQIDEEVVSNNDFRLRFSTVEYSLTGKKATIKVVLEKGGKYYEGQVAGIQTKYNSKRMIVEATLKAVENFLGVDELFIAEDVKVIEIADKRVVVTGIVFFNEYEEQFFTGCASINSDHKESIVKSTLDGINRKIVQYHNEN
ncbi:hypothetical protein [Sporosalibacterium faouarense]|uniref:hypothetical protein n=1 Tax=Sporosalibacterium faouarense TaxID=516123 RepID=UPI00141C8D9A|nr:hypothetical protein [Sporosalibacterium faouarense]MTI49740.1 hypothetical protein [Bacillota bacterium]